jgi:hypothetical protein
VSTVTVEDWRRWKAIQAHVDEQAVAEQFAKMIAMLKDKYDPETGLVNGNMRIAVTLVPTDWRLEPVEEKAPEER